MADKKNAIQKAKDLLNGIGNWFNTPSISSNSLAGKFISLNNGGNPQLRNQIAQGAGQFANFVSNPAVKTTEFLTKPLVNSLQTANAVTPYMAQSTNPVYSTVGNFYNKQRLATGNAVTNTVRGFDQFANVNKNLILPNSPEQKMQTIGQGLAATGKTVLGVGQTIASVNPWVMGLRGVSSTPQAQNMNVNVPFLGNVNVPDTLTSMVEFSKDPAWKRIFPQTSKLLTLAPTTNKVANFLFQRGVKGGTEGLIQAWSTLPEKATTEEKINHYLMNIGFGAFTEVGLDSFAKSIKWTGDKTKLKNVIVNLVDRISQDVSKFKKYAIEPAYASGKTQLQVDLRGRKLRNVSGAANPEELVNTVKELQQDPTQPSGVGGVSIQDQIKEVEDALKVNNKGFYGGRLEKRLADLKSELASQGGVPEGGIKDPIVGIGTHRNLKGRTINEYPVKMSDLKNYFGKSAKDTDSSYISAYNSDSSLSGAEKVFYDIVSGYKSPEEAFNAFKSGKLQPEGGVGVKKEATPLVRASEPQIQSVQGEQIKRGKAISTQTEQVNPVVETSGKNSSIVKTDSQPYFNTNRLKVSDKAKTLVKQTVSEVKPQIEKVVGSKLSNKEAIDFANRSSRVLHRAVDRQQTLEWEAALLKARQVLSSQAENGTVTKEYLDNLIAIKSLGTDTARKLQSFSIGAEPGEANAKGAILEAILKVTKDADKILKEAEGVDFNNYEQAATFYRKFVKPSVSDWTEKVRYTSMLSSPNTHINNSMSNLEGTALIAPIEKTITGMVDFLGSKVTGKKRSAFSGEGAAYMKGYWSKLGDASRKFYAVMSGKQYSSAQELHNLPLTSPGTLGRKIENTQTFFPRLLQAEDEFFSTLTEGGIINSLKYRESKGVGVQFPELKAAAEAKKRLFNAPFNLEEEGPLLKALEFIPMKVSEARSSPNPVISTIAKYTFPFVRIPSNILKASVEYSPLGVATLPGAKNKTEQLSKAILGTSIGLGTAMLVGSDRMTWAEPTDPKKKSMFRAAGMQPYSVKVGDKWISFSKLHPAISFNLALVAAVRDAERNKSLSESQVETVLNGVAKWANFYADMSYVKNIGDFVSTAKGDVEGISRYVSNYPQQLIPFRALMGWVTRIIDPYQRKVDSTGDQLTQQLQQIATQIPFLSQTIPARLDPSGKPIENQNRVFNAISPIGRVTTEKSLEKNKYLYLGGQTAKQTFNSLKELDPQDANRISQIIKANNPTLYSNLVQIQKQAKLGVTAREEQYINLSVSDRTIKVADEIRKLKTPEEKNALVKRYSELKIITDEVKKQLIEMKKRGEL